MGVMNKLMNFLGLQEEKEVIEREEMPVQEKEPEMMASSAFAGKRKNNVVSIHSQKNMRFILSEPRSYDEAQQLADHLRSRRPVVVNLQRVRKEQAMRIIDFLSGTVYALSGHISKVGSNIFLCTPDTVEVHGTITEMLQDESN